MANVKITITELKTLLECTPATHNLMLIGSHGIGKSEILTTYYSKKGLPVVTLFLGQMSDPGDLIGLPHKNEKTGKTEFLPPFWFPTDGHPVCLLLDELNRARPELLQCVMDLCLNRRLAGRELPEGSRIVSAINDGEQYELTELDPALISRFNIYHFSPTPGEWLLWASNVGIDDRVVKFIEDNQNMLDGDGKKDSEMSSIEKTPDRRAWTRVSDILKSTPAVNATTKKIVTGIVGARAAALFFESFNKDHLISANLILKEFDKYKKLLEGYQPHDIAIINESIFRCIENDKGGSNCADNLLSYLNWLISSGRRESMAHFCSVFEDSTYTKANLFMMSHSPECFKTITAFIKSL